MADQYTKTQLAKIVAPNLNDPSNYAGDLQKAFLAINENFKKIATMPFVQGVQGDSYKLDIRHIFENDILTEDGAILFNSMFDTDDFSSGIPVSTCISICRGLNLELNKVTPLEGFSNGKEINELYFYSVYNDEGVATNSYLGQLYYFVDSRLTEIGSSFSTNADDLNKFVDYSGFYRYEPINETTGRYVKTEILPTIYYDPERNDICWKLNGQETGISAVGAKGIDGTDASLTFVLVEPQDYNPQDPNFMGGVSAVTGVFKYGEYNEPGPDGWNKEPEDIKAIDNGVALICIKPQGSTVEYFAFGVIRTDGSSGKNAYWNDDTILDSFLEDEKINNYFSRIGYEENASSASCLSIPAILYHSISENAYDIRHTISTTGDINRKEEPGDLLFRMIYKDQNSNYRRYGGADGQTIKNFRIDNYNLVVQRIGTDDPITSDNPRFDLTNGFTKIAPSEIYLSANSDPDQPKESTFTKLSWRDSRFGAGLKVKGMLIAESSAKVNGDFTVKGRTNLEGDKTTIEGNLTLNGNMTVDSNKQIIGGGNPTGHGHFWRGKENAFILHDGYSADDMFFPVVTVKATNNGAYYSMGTWKDSFVFEYIPKEVHEGTKTDDQKNNLVKGLVMTHNDFTHARNILDGVCNKNFIFNNSVSAKSGLNVNNGVNVTGPSVLSLKFAYYNPETGNTDLFEQIGEVDNRPVMVPKKNYGAIWFNVETYTRSLAFPANLYDNDTIVFVRMLGGGNRNKRSKILWNTNDARYHDGPIKVWIGSGTFWQGGRECRKIFKVEAG